MKSEKELIRELGFRIEKVESDYLYHTGHNSYFTNDNMYELWKVAVRGKKWERAFGWLTLLTTIFAVAAIILMFQNTHYRNIMDAMNIAIANSNEILHRTTELISKVRVK